MFGDSPAESRYWPSHVRRGTGVILNIGWDQAAQGMEGDSGELFATSKNAIMRVLLARALQSRSQVESTRLPLVGFGLLGKQASEEWQSRVLRETPWLAGENRKILQVARFLVSDDASFLTGQIVNVNGGAVR
ncbi:MAG: hypothetical protein R3B91_13670 [Planctomycetaceae bacterium]